MLHGDIRTRTETTCAAQGICQRADYEVDVLRLGFIRPCPKSDIDTETHRNIVQFS